MTNNITNNPTIINTVIQMSIFLIAHTLCPYPQIAYMLTSEDSQCDLDWRCGEKIGAHF